MSRRSTALLPLALLLATGCPSGEGAATGSAGTPPPAAQDALEQVQARKKLVVAMDVGYDPFEVELPDGTYAGFDVDLAREIAQDLGVELELKNVAWVSIIPELQNGKVDAIISGMSDTPERRKSVSFSRAYFDIGQVVVKRKGDDRIKSYKDLNKKGMVIATQQGTTGEQAIKDHIPEAEIRQFDKIDLGCVDLAQGRCDAVVFDHPFLMKYVSSRTSELEGIWEPFTQEKLAVAIRLDSPKLVEAVDRTIERLEQSGALQELVKKHFPALAGEKK